LIYYPALDDFKDIGTRQFMDDEVKELIKEYYLLEDASP